MEKPPPAAPTGSIFDEVRSAAVECTVDQCRQLYAELVRQTELPRDIVTLFQNPQEEAPWEEFWRAIKKEFRVIDQRDLATLRFILDDNFRGFITKGNFVRFLLWFWPLLPDEDLYETATERKRPMTEDEDDNYVTAHQYDRDDAPDEDEGAPDSLEGEDDAPAASSFDGISKANVTIHRVHGWQVSEIAVHFLHKPWFHGFLSASQARERLQNEKAGTFLLRFSSVPPHFAIDLQDGFRVRHWRIEHHHKERKLSIFKDEYESLQQIVDVHSLKPLQLSSGSPSTLLREGLSRVAWDVTMAHMIIPTTAEALMRANPAHAAAETPWPPPADWSS